MSRVARPAVAGRGLVCEFGPVRAVDDLSFEVATGEVFGLLGPNGAGKTPAGPPPRSCSATPA